MNSGITLKLSCLDLVLNYPNHANHGNMDGEQVDMGTVIFLKTCPKQFRLRERGTLIFASNYVHHRLICDLYTRVSQYYRRHAIIPCGYIRALHAGAACFFV
jgi:hypothetical protein